MIAHIAQAKGEEKARCRLKRLEFWLESSEGDFTGRPDGQATALIGAQILLVGPDQGWLTTEAFLAALDDNLARAIG